MWSYLAFSVLRSDFSAHPARWQIHAMVALSFVYTFVCAFRSVLPRGDLPRLSLFGGWISSVPVGRSAATVAELCFVVQWAIALHYFGRLAKEPFSQKISYVLVPMIVVAECFSWYAVITKDSLENGIENSIWGLTFTLIIIALLRLRRRYSPYVRRAMDAVAVGMAAFDAFLIFVDVPMYIHRYLAENATDFYSFSQGLQHLFDPWLISADISYWQPEIPWMSFYFSLAVWSSLGLIVVAILKDRLPFHLEE
jgi:hypothetical protein